MSVTDKKTLTDEQVAQAADYPYTINRNLINDLAREVQRLRISEQVTHSYIRQTLEMLATAAGSMLVNPEGEPLRNFQLEDVVLAALTCTDAPA
jgi:hypothetical protein